MIIHNTKSYWFSSLLIILICHNNSVAGNVVFPDFIPGKEVRVNDPESGELGYYLVYLPAKYTPSHNWPAIICYHGMDQMPQTFPFKGFISSDQFIIIGMAYYQRHMEGMQFVRTKDVDILKHVIESLAAKLSIDKTRLFAGGFSKGGVYGSHMIRTIPDYLAGAIVLSAVNHELPLTSEQKALIKNKPVFTEFGDIDNIFSIERLRAGVKCMQDLGVDITVKEHTNWGHKVDTKSTLLRDWLLEHAYYKYAGNDILKAKKYFEQAEMGKAYSIYEQIIELPGACPAIDEAQHEHETISKRIQEKQTFIDNLVQEKKYAYAMALLADMAELYKGCETGTNAQKKLQTLRARPDLKDES